MIVWIYDGISSSSSSLLSSALQPWEGLGLHLRFHNIFVRGEVLSLTPNPQPGGPGYPFLSGSSPLTCLAWEALPVAYANTSIALGIIWPHKPHHYAKVGIPSGGYSKNKFEKLVHIVGFIIRIHHDARSPERQIHFWTDCFEDETGKYHKWHDLLAAKWLWFWLVLLKSHIPEWPVSGYKAVDTSCRCPIKQRKYHACRDQLIPDNSRASWNLRYCLHPVKDPRHVT